MLTSVFGRNKPALPEVTVSVPDLGQKTVAVSTDAQNKAWNILVKIAAVAPPEPEGYPDTPQDALDRLDQLAARVSTLLASSPPVPGVAAHRTVESLGLSMLTHLQRFLTAWRMRLTPSTHATLKSGKQTPNGFTDALGQVRTQLIGYGVAFATIADQDPADLLGMETAPAANHPMDGKTPLPRRPA